MFKQVLACGTLISALGAGLLPGLPSAQDATARSSASALGSRITVDSNGAQRAHGVPLFPAASDPMREGFVRVINRTDQDGDVAIAAIDDSAWHAPGIMLAIGGNETAHFNSNDLEQGNAGKGLSGGTGSGHGDWRLELTSDLEIEVLAYIRTTDGFLTAMHDVVERGPNGHRAAIFNPGRNRNQVSLLRLINPGAEDVEVTITGIDDAGTASAGEGGEAGAVRLTLPPGGARTVSSAALESAQDRDLADADSGNSDDGDASALTGELGPGTGKWQLLVTSEQPVVAMSLLMSPTGHLTNLSTAPFRTVAADNQIRQMAENTEAGVAIGEPVTADLGDGAVLIHTLEGPDADSFDIDSPSGQLRTREGAAYDFESQSTYKVVVRVSDALGGVVRIGVTVEVTDEDEPPAKPDPPEVEGFSSRSVRVSWDEPENTGPAIDDYDVEYRRPGAAEYTDAEHDGIEREIEIVRLRAGADYEFRVRASNAEGTGEWSDPTVGRPRSGGGGGGTGGGTGGGVRCGPEGNTDPRPLIESPTSFTVEENDLSVGRVRACDPDSGDSITGFTIAGGADETLLEIAAGGDLRFRTAPDFERPEDRFNADPINDPQNNEYVIEIEAHSGTGAGAMTSEPQAITVTVTDIDEPPQRPDPPTVENSTLDSLSIRWQPPVNTGPPIDDYDYRYRENRSGVNWTEVVDTTLTSTQVTLTDLEEQTEYRIEVRASNDEGTSRWSRYELGTTADNQAPVFREGSRAFRFVPENTTGTNDIGNPIAADDNDGGAPAYSLEGADAGKFRIDPDTGQLRTASGATYDHEADPEHEVTVRADDGQGGSATIAVTVDVLDELEPPASPAQPRVTTVDTMSVAVSWMPPANAGRPPIMSYDVQRRIKDSGDSYLISNRNESGPTARIENLDPQTTYEVQVRAVNAEGEGAWSPPGNGATDLTTPEALFVSFTSDAGSDDVYKLDDAIEATVGFSEAVAVRGTPQLSLMVGQTPRRADYKEGTGSDELVFAYEVTDTDQDDDGVSIPADALRLNGGAIRKDGYTLDAILTLAGRSDMSSHKTDGIKPRLEYTELKDDELTLSYSEPINDSPAPATADFQVTVAGAARAVSTVDVTDTEVVLTLVSTAAIGDPVTMSYPGTGANPLRDAAGNEADSFTNRSVDNQTSGVCDRTAQVSNAIVEDAGVSSCSDVTADHLFEIVELDLELTGITQLQAGDFAAMTALEELYLAQNTLTSLPDNVFSGLSTLEVLDLGDNDLDALTDSIFSDLTKLEILGLGGNEFATLPDVFTGLPALEFVDLDGNNLSALPSAAFSGLPSLEWLWLAKNGFSTLTADMLSGLTKLRWLDLDGNRFSDLPSGVFSGLTQLRWLWLAENRLAALPDGLFSGLTALTRIELAGNPQDPLSLTVTLEKTGTGRFRASVPSAAPFELLLPVRVANGIVSGGHTHITVPQGSTESLSYSVSRNSGSSAAVTVDIGVFPELPEADTGYELARSDDLPLEVIAANPGVGIHPGTLTVREAGENRYSVVLNSRPTADATVTATVPQNTDIEANPTPLTFTPDNWHDRQWVTVTSMADADTDNETFTISHSVDGGDYAGLSVSGVSVTVAENLADTNAAPEFTSDAEFDAGENEAAVGNVVATDSDTDDYITGYSIGGGVDSAWFAITDEGALSFVDAPDFEKPEDLESTSPANDADNNEYIVKVTATGGSGARELTATQTITVTVKDETEPPGTPAAPIVLSTNLRNALAVRPGRRPLINTGLGISHYKLRYRKKNRGSFMEFPNEFSVLRINVFGLDTTSTYEFQARAVNDEGPSHWSLSGEGTTPDNRNPQFLADRVSRVDATAGGADILVPARTTFTDPDGDPLDIEASSSNERVATVETPGILAAIAPLASGTATITLKASDPYGGTARGSFRVSVRSATVPDPSVTIDDTAKTITVAFTQPFAANEIRAYDFRVRQKEPRGGWDSFCRAFENAEATQRSIDVSSELPVGAFYEAGITYEVEYRYFGNSCAGDSTTPSPWSRVAEATAGGSSSFDIDVVFVGTEPSATFKQAFRDAADRWEEIITRSLPDIDFSNQALAANRCTVGQPEVTDTVDDLRIYAKVTEIDDEGGTLAVASVCVRRLSSTLPVVSKVIVDSDDAAVRTNDDLKSIILHEIGHTLGIGTLWYHHDLLQKPALDPDDEEYELAPDTHFTGPLTTAAFDAAGGLDYADNKVPVHNSGGSGSADSHWRESVFDNELMSPQISSGQTEPLSAITVRSLADMGYVVDVGEADSYMLPSAMSRMPGHVAKAAGVSVPLNCIIEPSVGTVEDGGRKPVILEPRDL